MQRTEPPPSVSMVGTGDRDDAIDAAAKAFQGRSAERRMRARRHRQHAARTRRTQFEHVARKARHLRGVDDLDVPAAGREARQHALAVTSIDRSAATTAKREPTASITLVW